MLLKSWNYLLAAAFTLSVSAKDCCSSLNAQYPEDVFFPGTTTYLEEAVTSFWSNTSRISPRCVFIPESAHSVSHALQLFEAEKCAFALRGGGHSPNEGWSNIRDGVLVAMSRFNELSLHEGYVSVGTGLRWGPVFDFLQPHGLVVVGGRTPDVGVSGLTLGGGLSHFSGWRGLACDNVKSLQIVISGGHILEVNRNSHPDLFWAIKGSGNKFGIVTRLDLYTYYVPQVYAGTGRLEMEHFDLWAKAVDNFVRVRSAGFQGEYTAISPKMQYVPSLGEPFLLIPMLSTIIPQKCSSAEGNASIVLLPPPLKDFANLPYTGRLTMKSQTVPELFSETRIPSGLRYELRTLSFKSSFDILKGIKKIVEEEFEPLLVGTPGFSSVLEFQPITKETILQGLSRGSNSLGIDVDDTPMIWLVMANSWLNACDDEAVHLAGERVVQRGQALARDLGLYVPFLFSNDAAANQAVIASYGRTSVEKLNEVAKEYDPATTFTNLISGGFPIPEATINYDPWDT